MLLPFTLMMFCGLDPQDALAFTQSAIKDGMIDSKGGKTAEPVWIPLPQPVKDALAIAPMHNAITVCANSWGRVLTTGGLRASWRPIKKRLEEEAKIGGGLTLKGLRHTVASILAEMGYDDRTIADMLGQKTLAMAQHYSRRANRTRKLTAVVESFDAEVNRRRTENWQTLPGTGKP